MFTIEELLTMQSLDGLRIIAGEEGIHNTIESVNIMDNPEPFDWLQPNELVVTTGYFYKDSEAKQLELIKELSEINCAGLCIKTKRYFDTIPQNMIDLANEYGLPLLELPFKHPFSRVMAEVAERVSDKYGDLNKKLLDMHEMMFSIALEGGGIGRIAQELSKFVLNPIVFVDRNWNLLYYLEHEDNPYPLETHISLKKNQPTFSEEFIQSIPKRLYNSAIKRYYSAKGQHIKCRVLPVIATNHIYGYIIVWQTLQELAQFNHISMERYSMVVALEMIKAKEIEDEKSRVKQNFLYDLLIGSFKTIESVQTLCNLHDLNPYFNYYCVTIKMEFIQLEDYEDMVMNRARREEMVRSGLDTTYRFARKLKGVVTCFPQNNQLIMLVGNHKSAPPDSLGELKKIYHELQVLLAKNVPSVSFRIGIGGQYEAITSLHKSFFETNEALRMAQNFSDSQVAHFEDYTVPHFLDANVKKDELEAFFMKCLGKIYYHDLSHGANLLLTLENYCLYNCNISEAAKAMFIHRNTFIYRIEKIKDLLNIDLRNAEELLQVQLALRIFRLIHQSLQERTENVQPG